MTGPALLSLEDVSASYGPFRALFGVSFEVAEGEAVALLGTNGAGKTTVARVATGLIPPTTGRVLLAGEDMSERKAYEFARAGVNHAPEGRSVFASLTVDENLTLAFREAVGRAETRHLLDTAYEMFPRLSDRRGQLAGSLSGGEQRMLALARVLVHPPRLLVVDELSLGLAPIIIEEVYRNLASLREKGVALIVVEQQVEHALDLADRVVVLSRGEISYDGPVRPVEELAPHFLPEAAPVGDTEP